MDRRWSNAEVTLPVGFGGRLVEHVGIDIHEGRILALSSGKAMRAVGPRGAAASAIAKPSTFRRWISTSIRYGDSIACTSVERRKLWYDGGGRLLERQKSQ